jgi:hypothetical protein
MVYGTVPRGGYRNTALPKAVMDVLFNEAGLEACLACGVMDDEEDVIARIQAAQSTPMEPRALEDEKAVEDDGTDGDFDPDPHNELGETNDEESSGNPPPAPRQDSPSKAKAEDASKARSTWREFRHPGTGTTVTVPSFVPHPSDAAVRKDRKTHFHKMLESFCRQFIGYDMTTEALRLTYFLAKNNLSTLRSLNSYTQEVHKEFMKKLPGEYEGSDMQETAEAYVENRRTTLLPDDVAEKPKTLAKDPPPKRKAKLSLPKPDNKKKKVQHQPCPHAQYSLTYMFPVPPRSTRSRKPMRQRARTTAKLQRRKRLEKIFQNRRSSNRTSRRSTSWHAGH